MARSKLTAPLFRMERVGNCLVITASGEIDVLKWRKIFIDNFEEITGEKMNTNVLLLDGVHDTLAVEPGFHEENKKMCEFLRTSPYCDQRGNIDRLQVKFDNLNLGSFMKEERIIDHTILFPAIREKSPDVILLGYCFSDFSSLASEVKMFLSEDYLFQESKYADYEHLLSEGTETEKYAFTSALHSMCKDDAVKASLKTRIKEDVEVFNEAQDAKKYIDAVLEGGLVNEAKVKLMFLGTTEGGKSSLAGCFENNEAFLTGNTDKKHTKIMDIKKNVSMKNSKEKLVITADNTIEFEASSTDDTEEARTQQPNKVTILDAGGHGQYYEISSAFLSGNTIIPIVFNGPEYEKKCYPQRVGCYVDLVAHKSKPNSRPTVILVASHLDKSKDREELKKRMEELGETVKGHVKEMQVREGLNMKLAGEVVQLSSANKENVDKLMGRINLIIENEELMPIQKTYPFNWKSFMETLENDEDQAKFTLSEVSEKYESFVKETGTDSLGDVMILTDEERKELSLLSKALEGLPSEPENQSSSDDLKGLVVDLENVEESLPNREKGGEETFLLKDVGVPQNMSDAPVGETSNPKDQKEVSKTVQNDSRIILEFGENRGDLLWLKDSPGLEKVVFIPPIVMVESLRSVIRHDVAKAFDEPGKNPNLKTKFLPSILNKGIISQKALDMLLEDQTDEASIDILNILQGLKIAFKWDDSNFFIPYLISEEKRCKFLDAGSHSTTGKPNKWKSKNSLIVEYDFHNQRSSVNIYNAFLMKVADCKGAKSSVSFDTAFAQKKEEREIGCVSGMEGTWKWETKDGKPREYNFRILEFELADEDDEERPFAILRRIRIIMNHIDHDVDQDMWELVHHLDDVMMKLVGPDLLEASILKKVICSLCLDEGAGGEGFFKKYDKFLEPVENVSCQEYVIHRSGGHRLQDFKDTKIRVQSENPPIFHYKTFLERGIKSIKKYKISDIETALGKTSKNNHFAVRGG